MLASVLLYSALPFFGDAWHNFVPEHEHWYLGGSPFSEEHAHTHAHTFDHPKTLAPASPDVTPAPQISVAHVFDPGSALSALAVFLALDGGIVLVAPPGPSHRVVHPAIAVVPPLLIPPDPPPELG